MRISIVVPPFDYGKSLYGLSKSRSFHNAVPLGAISVAAFLREEGHQVQVVDAPSQSLDVNGICAELNRFNPDTIGLGCTSLIYPSARATAAILKERIGVPLFIGGPHASLYPKEVMEDFEWDFAVFGEGEETSVEAMDRLSRGESLDGVAGVIFRDPDGRLVKNRDRLPIGNLDDAPLPAYDLLDLSRYSAPPMRIRNTPAVYMDLFRGCAYAKCTYCTSGTGLKNRYRRHSPKGAADKVMTLHMKYGVKEIAFVDDDFVVGKDWIYDFCGELRARGNPVTWTAYCRASQVDAGIFLAMKAAGCHQVLIGMEVLDNEVLRLLQKDLSVASCGAAVRAAHSAGISVIGLFMCGVPHTSPESVYQTVEHALQQKVDIAVFSLYRPPPGSPEYETLGWGAQEYIECFKDQREAVYVPDGWEDLEMVEQVLRNAYRKFYLDPRFLKHTAKRAAADPLLARNIVRGALTLADQFRPSISELLGSTLRR